MFVEHEILIYLVTRHTGLEVPLLSSEIVYFIHEKIKEQGSKGSLRKYPVTVVVVRIGGRGVRGIGEFIVQDILVGGFTRTQVGGKKAGSAVTTSNKGDPPKSSYCRPTVRCEEGRGG